MTDVSTTRRRKLSTRDRLRVWEKFGGVCQGPCGRKLSANDKWIAEHPIPLGLGGTDDREVLELWCEWCADNKTHTEDIPRIAKAKRQKAKHLGIKQPKGRPLPGTKASGIRKRMNGDVERW